jgi:hypothetical protein
MERNHWHKGHILWGFFIVPIGQYSGGYPALTGGRRRPALRVGELSRDLGKFESQVGVPINDPL